ncbi:MAG: capsular polysaccharide synthesis protein [Oscillospiraceae bacterium]|nr:capsular polysaccharide synthesis protein [Oscillospiraceae bacterium]
MIRIFKKVFSILKELFVSFFADLKCFSLKIACYSFFRNLLWHVNLFVKFRAKCENRYTIIVYNHLLKKYGYVIDKYKTTTEFAPANQSSTSKKIWVLWWQGVENAPPLVKICINSIIKNSNGHEVVLLNENNYLNYAKIPREIINKYKKGKIGRAHFSDILRISLLEEHGGLWLDATILVAKPIPATVFEQDYYTPKNLPDYTNYFSGEQWAPFCFGFSKQALLSKVLKELFFEYWSHETRAIDYLLFDYFIKMCYDNIKAINVAMDNLEYNNPKINYYQDIMNQPFNANTIKEMQSSDTFIFKLSWRMNFLEKTPDGKDTFYGTLLQRGTL